MIVLVTGGAGFIGSHVCEALLKRRDKVICVDNFNDYYSPEAKERNIAPFLKNKDFKLFRKDITDKESIKDIFNSNKIDKVIHLAARAGVRPSIENPELYYSVNILGTINMLELSRTHAIKSIVFGSSSSVYGLNRKIPFSESDPTDSQVSPYASSKKCGEIICESYSRDFGMNITCLRFFTVYGPRGRPDMAPYKFTEAVLNNRPITMYGDGSSQRDYTYVTDIAQGIIAALDRGLRFEIINLGDSRPVKLFDLIRAIEKHTGKAAKITQKPMPECDVPVTYADISKAKKLLSYSPEVSLEKGIGLFVAWYRENP